MNNTLKAPLILDILDQSKDSNLKNPLPVWLMRQAGRYLPEYRKLKEKYSFNELSENPDLASEVTCQPLVRFKELDAAIFFADILTPSKALGFEFNFQPGPVLSNPIKIPEDIYNLRRLDLEASTGFVYEGIRRVREFLNSEKRERRRAMLGFAATPWTLACYLIDQGIYKQHLGTKIFAKKYKTAFEDFCQLITEVTISYLKNKYSAGADAVQLFDTWASLLNPDEYENFSGKWVKKIIDELKQAGIPVILYTQGDLEIIKKGIEMGPNALSIDWRTSITKVRQIAPDHLAIQGNIDPCVLFSDSSEIIKAVQVYKEIRSSKVIVNLGHGILPATPIEAVETFLKAIKEL